jgi:hypothetical protein
LIETRNEIEEMEGEDEDDDEKGDLTGNTKEDKPILFASHCMGRMSCPNKRFTKLHYYTSLLF